MNRRIKLATRLASVLLLLLAAGIANGQNTTDQELWAAREAGGNVVLMRHAIAPGGGDPPGFRLEDCSTQRNLSEEGRAQARSTGEAFRSGGTSCWLLTR